MSPRKPRWVISREGDAAYRYELRAANGRVLHKSEETFRDVADAARSIRALVVAATSARVVEAEREREIAADALST